MCAHHEYATKVVEYFQYVRNEEIEKGEKAAGKKQLKIELSNYEFKSVLSHYYVGNLNQVI